ncbi:MAG TPA: hypothetical protein VF064_13750 [Pyrinomonadaceae bacterium]
MNSRRRNLTALALLVLLAAAAFGQDAGDRNVRRLPVPGRTWAVEIALPNFNVRHDALSADGRARKLRADIESEGYVVTVTIVPASTPRVSSKDLRDLAAERVRAGVIVRRENIKTSDYKKTPTLEYLVRDFRGQSLYQKHLNAYVSRDNVWIDIHFSKAPFRDGDEKLFYAILDTLKFTQ